MDTEKQRTGNKKIPAEERPGNLHTREIQIILSGCSNFFVVENVVKDNAILEHQKLLTNTYAVDNSTNGSSGPVL